MSAEPGMGRPLQNRVDPFGTLQRVAARGTMMGNRGGRFHRGGQWLAMRRWVRRQWLICLCEFKGRRRDVWGQGCTEGCTELFFLDEVTGLAAGHRPCFECRRAAATAFRVALGVKTAADLDELLHRERLQNGHKRSFLAPWRRLPDGAMFALGAQPYALHDQQALLWSFAGYRPARALPDDMEVTVLTPPQRFWLWRLVISRNGRVGPRRKPRFGNEASTARLDKPVDCAHIAAPMPCWLHVFAMIADGHFPLGEDCDGRAYNQS